MSCRNVDLKTHSIRAIVGSAAVDRPELTITAEEDAEFVLGDAA
jgi:hypothetical protein